MTSVTPLPCRFNVANRRKTVGVTNEWTPKDFRAVVQRVTSARGETLASMEAQIQRRGFLSCPPPPWDPEGVYRVALNDRGPEIQRLTEEESWVQSRLLSSGGSGTREKHQKFRILDSPGLLLGDLMNPPGPMGCALIYLDIDHFKELNTRFTERVVDRCVLPEFHRLVDEMVRGHGYVYAEGGDEVVALLHNMNEFLALGFAEMVRTTVERTGFCVDGVRVTLTVSQGLACALPGTSARELPDRANTAKAQAKKQGRNVVCVYQPDGIRAVRLSQESAHGPSRWKGAFRVGG